MLQCSKRGKFIIYSHFFEIGTPVQGEIGKSRCAVLGQVPQRLRGGWTMGRWGG